MSAPESEQGRTPTRRWHPGTGRRRPGHGPWRRTRSRRCRRLRGP
ncbi:hypothetical protein ACFFX0_15150 [Citricoccus parietis]|uniref:Uncharacterized protein n=1 Tax=Citricoccus parietis TaxID=592307 RepID=A0ABV5G0K2_9MICC